jgi:hypothetical protein
MAILRTCTKWGVATLSSTVKINCPSTLPVIVKIVKYIGFLYKKKSLFSDNFRGNASVVGGSHP